MEPILATKNIFTNCSSLDKESAIINMGTILYNSGYCTKKYIQGMIEKETVMNTYIGNGVAIPHGIETMRTEVIKTGLAISVYPKGIDWGNNNYAYIVIGIAAIGNEQVNVLSRIAQICIDEKNVQKILTYTPEQIGVLFNAAA